MNALRSVLLTVSGRIPDDLDEQVAAGHRPRADYAVMRDAFDADLVDVNEALRAAGRFGQVLYWLGGAGLLLGWHCFRRNRQYEVIVTDGEQVGLPLALLSRFRRGTARHLMIVHIVSTPKKARLIRLGRVASMIDRYVVYCSWQRNFLCNELSVPVEHVLLTPFMVDTVFFDPSSVSIERGQVICSAGLERRDYPTLVEAVRGLNVRVVIAAASPWSTQADSTEGQALPSNVEIRRVSLFELRDLYATSQFVVMPLEDVEFQAGITTILEAMSMGLAVVCTRSRGQTDTVIDGETGSYVPPGDVAALRAAIERLLDDDDAARIMGLRAREWAEQHADVERYADRLRAEIEALRRQPHS